MSNTFFILNFHTLSVCRYHKNRDFIKNGVRALSARENITDDASGVLMEAVLEGMAEYYECVK